MRGGRGQENGCMIINVESSFSLAVGRMTDDVIPKQILKNFKGRRSVARPRKALAETGTGYNVDYIGLTVK